MNPLILKYTKQINSLWKKIHVIQAECPHKNFISEVDSDTGNYDPCDDKYWVLVQCLDCDKEMSFDSKKEIQNYRKYTQKL